MCIFYQLHFIKKVFLSFILTQKFKWKVFLLQSANNFLYTNKANVRDKF